MEHLIDLGGNIIMFPEGVWDKSKNLPCLKLFPGIYKVAKEKNAIIVPIVSIQENNKTYVKRLPAFDITKYDEKKGREILIAILALDKMDLMIIILPILSMWSVVYNDNNLFNKTFKTNES